MAIGHLRPTATVPPPQMRTVCRCRQVAYLADCGGVLRYTTKSVAHALYKEMLLERKYSRVQAINARVFTLRYIID